jgi:hypothetical protein
LPQKNGKVSCWLMRYQLVLQFRANTSDDFCRLVVLEEKLIQELGRRWTVTTLGLSEFNIFVLTDEPAMIFDKAHRVVREEGLQHRMRATFRESTGERYVILWPSTLAEFSVS